MWWPPPRTLWGWIKLFVCTEKETAVKGISEAKKRSVRCPKCGRGKGRPCVSSRQPGANTFGGGWGGPSDLDRAHPARLASFLEKREEKTLTREHKAEYERQMTLAHEASKRAYDARSESDWLVAAEHFDKAADAWALTYPEANGPRTFGTAARERAKEIRGGARKVRP